MLKLLIYLQHELIDMLVLLGRLTHVVNIHPHLVASSCQVVLNFEHHSLVRVLVADHHVWQFSSLSG